jgi:hypothetical protein
LSLLGGWGQCAYVSLWSWRTNRTMLPFVRASSFFSGFRTLDNVFGPSKSIGVVRWPGLYHTSQQLVEHVARMWLRMRAPGMDAQRDSFALYAHRPQRRRSLDKLQCFPSGWVCLVACCMCFNCSYLVIACCHCQPADSLYPRLHEQQREMRYCLLSVGDFIACAQACSSRQWVCWRGEG